MDHENQKPLQKGTKKFSVMLNELISELMRGASSSIKLWNVFGLWIKMWNWSLKSHPIHYDLFSAQTWNNSFLHLVQWKNNFYSFHHDHKNVPLHLGVSQFPNQNLIHINIVAGQELMFNNLCYFSIATANISKINLCLSHNSKSHK